MGYVCIAISLPTAIGRAVPVPSCLRICWKGPPRDKGLHVVGRSVVVTDEYVAVGEILSRRVVPLCLYLNGRAPPRLPGENVVSLIQLPARCGTD